MTRAGRALITRFIDEHGDIILKPLDGMGGSSVFRVRRDDPNRNVIVETLTQLGSRTIMAQRFIPEIAQGDKRILLIDGEPVPYCLARIPKAGETRGNLAAGGTRRGAAAVGARPGDRRAVGADAARARLAARRPGRDRRLPHRDQRHQPDLLPGNRQQTGFDVAGMFVDALERKWS